MRRIDAHTHLVPAAYRAELARRDLIPPYGVPEWSRNGMIAFLDDHEIDAAIASLPPPGVAFGDPDLAVNLSRIVNEATAELVAFDRSRFAGLAVLPIPDIDQSMAALRYAFDELGLDGVALMTNAAGVYVGDARLDPLMAELDRRAAYVLVHPTTPAPGYPLDYPAWLLEFPFDTTRAIVHLIYSGTLERYPRIRFQVCHLGGAAPYLAHRIASLAERSPAHSAQAPAGAHDYLARLWYDTAQAATDVAIAAARAVVPLERIVFGSDWPYVSVGPAGDPEPGLDCFGAERAAVDGEHVRELVPRFARR